MRGATSGAARGAAPAAHPAAVHAPGTAAAAVGEEALLLLREIRDDVQAARRALESRGGA
jgi:hypothetical protein